MSWISRPLRYLHVSHSEADTVDQQHVEDTKTVTWLVLTKIDLIFERKQPRIS